MDQSPITQSDAELRSHVERVLAPTYELEREIGRGGMGIVFLARDARLKRRVAIKLLPPELSFRSEIRSRFLREAETAAQLSHPSIVPIYSVDEKQGLVFFVMAYVDGENLARMIHDRGALDPARARQILREVADALAYAHDHGVVHRDIKPDNILIDSQSGRPMVTDFGIARAVTESGESRLTATGIAIGTPAFMSPEQSAGDRELDGRSDLYSLGVVAYQMLCGELPFVANNTPALLVKHLSEAPVPVDRRRDDVPADLARAVMICLEKNPADRYPTAHALVESLDSGVVPARPASQAGTARPAAADAAFAGGTESPPAAIVPVQAGAASPPALWTASARTGPLDDDPRFLATPAEQARWLDPAVDGFRRKVIPFLYITALLTLMRVVGGPNLLFVSAFWGIAIAYRYARLWSDGYDWHDVFRVPRERLFWDAAGEWFAHNVQSIWDKEKRIEARAHRRRALIGGADGSRGLATQLDAADPAVLGVGPQAALARQALADRDEIRRIVLSLPASEQRRMKDVPVTAGRLADAVVALAARLNTVEPAAASSQSAAAIDVEIRVLESQANPLDAAASDVRVRRLAALRRQKRSIADVEGRRQELQSRCDNCALMLQNLKLDVLRLKAGGQSWEHMTTIAEQASAVAREVDGAVYVADELRRLRAPQASGNSAGRKSGEPRRR